MDPSSSNSGGEEDEEEDVQTYVMPAAAAAAAPAAPAADDTDVDTDEEQVEVSSEDSNPDDNDISDYERLRLERIKRNEARLVALGLTNISTTKEVKKRKRKVVDLEPVRQQPKRQSAKFKPVVAVQEPGDEDKKNEDQKKKPAPLRCGTCEGCLLETNCDTCLHCVERERSGGRTRRRCLFRQCRQRHKEPNDDEDKKKKPPPPSTRTTRTTRQSSSPDDVLLEDVLPEAEEVLTVPEPPTECDICHQTDYLIACTNCHRGYHSNCHVPKIKHLPHDEDPWLCMDCHPKSAKQQGKGWLWAVLPSDDQYKLAKVKVLEPPHRCVVCYEICAPERTHGAESVHCKACDEYYHWECHTNDPEQSDEEKPKGRALNSWKCHQCLQANKPILPHHQPPPAVPKKKPTKKKRPTNDALALLTQLQQDLFEGEHDDDCYICDNGGELVCCDFCPKVFHCGCHIPALPALPTGIWKCCECYAAKRQKVTRCGECPACLTKYHCGECKVCLLESQTNNNNQQRLYCEKKPKCPNPSFAETYVPGKIPGEIYTQQEIDDITMHAAKDKRRKKSIGTTTTTAIRYFNPDESTDEEEDDDDIIVKLPIPKLMDPESVKIRKIINGARRSLNDHKALMTIRSSQQDAKVQDKACEQLRKLASANTDKIILLGGIEMISDAMAQHPDKAILQAEACATIAELAWVDPKVAIKLAHTGVVQKIIHCMEEFPTNAKVQKMACGAFRALSYEGSSIVVINNAYGINATLNSIKRNPRKLAVQKEACVFLQNMFVQSADVVAEKILATEVLDTLLASLCNEDADGDLRTSILRVISNLAIHETAKTTMCENESVVCAIVTELQRHQNLAVVRQAACAALQNISSVSSTNKYKIFEAGGVGALVDAARAFPNNPSLLESTFDLMQALINGNDEKDVTAATDFVGNHNGKALLLSAMEEHMNTAHVLIAACGVIAYLPFANNKEDASDVQLADAIVGAMRKHPDSVFVQGACVEAVLELATHVPAAREHLHRKQPETRRLLLHAKNVNEATTVDVDEILELLPRPYNSRSYSRD